MVSVADTAAPQQDTAAPEGLTPPASPTETLAPPATETVAPQSTETVTPPESTEAAPPPRGIDDLSDEELDSHPRFKDRLARASESERQQRLDETQRKNNELRQAWFDSGQYTASLAQAATLDDEGNVRVDPKKASEIGASMWEAASFGAFGTLDNLVKKSMPADYRLPREATDRLEAVRKDVDAGRKPLDALVQATLETYREVVIETELPKRIDTEKRTWQREQDARNETERLRAAEQLQQTQPTPSRGTGAAGRTWASQREIDTAVANGQLDRSDYRTMRYDGSYDALPW
jgi:hypothetical protein